MPTPVQLVLPVAAEVYARTFWGDVSGGERPCPASWKGYHDAKTLLRRTEDPLAEPDEVLREEAAERYPERCAFCGQKAPPEALRHVAALTVYRGAADGEERVGLHGKPGSRFGLRPGDAYWAPWHHAPGEDSGCTAGWSNCRDPRGHLCLVLPDGQHFDTSSRARNCSRPKDRRHRCWTVEGTPEGGDLSVGKGGDTCKAGAGSVDTGTWHGFVRDGMLTP